jgi:hypothetical protein
MGHQKYDPNKKKKPKQKPSQAKKLNRAKKKANSIQYLF